MSYTDDQYQGLLAERDKFSANAVALEIKWIDALNEIDKLKAGIQKLSCPVCGSDVDGINWKSKAEKLAKALIKINLLQYVQDLQDVIDIAKEALVEFEKAAGK